MKMDKVAGSGNDEFYTPYYAIEPLIKYLKDKQFKKVICPFDTKESRIYKKLIQEGFEVTQSHLEEGADFFVIKNFSSIGNGSQAVVTSELYKK